MLNILLNWSFEDDIDGDGLPDDWEAQIWQAVKPYDIQFGLSSDAVSGTRSAIITFNALSTMAQAVFTQTIDASKIKPLETVYISSSYKTKAPIARVLLEFFDENWVRTGVIGKDLPDAGDGTWHTISLEGVAPENFANVRFHLVAQCSPTASFPVTAQFDAARVDTEYVPPPPPGPPPTAPVLQGWGGVRLYEVNCFSKPLTGEARTEPPSDVFPDEVASNVEMTMRLLKEQGYNTIRAYFEDPRDNINGRDLTLEWERYWVWNPEWFEKFVELARHYDLWMICDYHQYGELYLYEEEWISLWRIIISTYKNLYDKLVWEPCNEPLIPNDALTEEQKVQELGRLYQRWIDMCRGLGDTHWIIASGLCWWSSLPPEEWYPILNDPLNKTFLNYHFYYFKSPHEAEWTIPAAQAWADMWTAVAIRVQQKYNKPFLTTETGVTEEPYDEVGLAFITRLIQNFQRERMGYILWTAGDWTYGLELYGNMNTWGKEIPLPPQPPGQLQVRAYSDDTEVSASVEVVKVGTYTTPFSVELDPRTYELKGTYDTQEIPQTATIESAKTTNVEFKFSIPPEPPPPQPPPETEPVKPLFPRLREKLYPIAPKPFDRFDEWRSKGLMVTKLKGFKRRR